jgi:hypothetical protein
VMLSDDLAERIAQRAAEVLVRGQDFAGRQEFDDGLRARECFKLAGIVDRLLLGLGDVGSEFYDLTGFPLRKTGL